MRSISVNSSKKYQILIESGLIKHTGSLIKSSISGARNCFLLTDSVVRGLYSGVVIKSLEENGFFVSTAVIPSGEDSKSQKTLFDVLETMSKNSLSRSDVLIALGGGVVGDIGGLCAALYMRGMRFVQIPTTIIAQTDSSVGGKTAVNFGGAKNLIGTFYQPDLVIIDPETLSTLDRRNYNSGMAEVIKYGCIACPDIFNQPDLSDIIYRCCDIKRQIVERDEHDNGERRVLNFGHTIGHAIEAASGNKLHHGESVAIGMTMIAKLGERIGETEKGTSDIIINELNRFDLPTEPPKSCDYIPLLGKDKKRTADEITLVMLKNIGTPVIRKMSISKLSEVLS